MTHFSPSGRVNGGFRWLPSVPMTYVEKRIWKGEEMYLVLVVEDEAGAADDLAGLLTRYAEQRSLAFDVTVMGSAIKLLDFREHYEICLFDIGLPGISGMEAAQMLRLHDRVASIIFVTSLAKFAVKGYEVGACGFVLKPVSPTSLFMALDRAVRQLGSLRQEPLQVRTAEALVSLAPRDLAFAESRDHDIRYHLADGSVLTARARISELEGLLHESSFLRVGRSYLVNLACVASVRGNDMVMTCGDRLRIPRGRKGDVTCALASYLRSR